MGEDASSRPPRVYVPDLADHRTAPEANREILLSKEERIHVRSRRLRDGDEIIALDGKGLRAQATLTRSGTAVTLLSFEASSSSKPRLPGEPANRVTVALACAEPARVEWAVEKGTECGAAGFVLLACERSQRAHVTALSSPARLARLRRIAVEATKQCDRTIVPFVEGPKDAEEFLGGLGGERLIVLHGDAAAGASPAPGAPSPSHVNSLRKDSTRGRRGGPGPLLGGSAASFVAVGPEGGFSPSELSLFAGVSAVFLSLGPRILRLETAVVAALSRLVDGC
jgi:16S rRNA (uracil1498-N3)-methyltransferase